MKLMKLLKNLLTLLTSYKMWVFLKILFCSPKGKELDIQISDLNLGDKFEKEFTGFYDKFFTPLLNLLQIERIKKLRTVKLYTSFAALSGIITIFALQKFLDVNLHGSGSSRYHILFFIILVLTSVLLIRKATHHHQKYHSFVKYNLVKAVIKFFGDFSYYNTVSGDQQHLDYKSYDILPKCDLGCGEDLVIGKYKNTKIKMMELEMLDIIEDHHNSRQPNMVTGVACHYIKKMRNRHSNSTHEFDTKLVAKGIIVEIEFRKKFTGKTLITKDRGKFLNFTTDLANKYDKVTLEDPLFEKKFEIYGTDQIESRVLLTPSFMQRIIDLSDYFKGAPIEACFHQANLFLFIKRKGNLFDQNSLISKKDLTKYIQKTITETHDILKIIDILKLDKDIVI